MGKFDVAIFDMDGTIIDSEPLAALTMVEVLETTMGVSLTKTEVIERYAARELDYMIDDLCENYGARRPTNFREVLAESYAPIAEKHLKATVGAAETLQALASIKRCLASNGEEDYVKYSLDMVGLLKYFDATFSFSDTGVAKPAPDLYLLVAESMNVHPSRCIVLEDRDVGIEAALAAGMTTVGFVGNNKTRAESLNHFGVDVIDDMTHFIDLALA